MIPSGIVQLTAKVVVPVTASTVIQNLVLFHLTNQSGTFSQGGATAQLPGDVCAAGLPACVIGGGLGGRMGLDGQMVVVFGFTKVIATVDLNDALIGQGGSTNSPFTFNAAAWTDATGAIQTPNATLLGHGSGSIGGSQVTLVTPTYVDVVGTLVPLFTTLTLSFVPEPGTLLLLGIGAAGLVLVGRRGR